MTNFICSSPVCRPTHGKLPVTNFSLTNFIFSCVRAKFDKLSLLIASTDEQILYFVSIFSMTLMHLLKSRGVGTISKLGRALISRALAWRKGHLTPHILRFKRLIEAVRSQSLVCLHHSFLHAKSFQEFYNGRKSLNVKKIWFSTDFSPDFVNRESLTQALTKV